MGASLPQPDVLCRSLGNLAFIYYRRSSMKVSAPTEPLKRELAAEYAGWFRALSDPTRVQVLSLLARARRPMRVGEIVSAIGVAQSTVSHHLAVLGEVGFLHAEPQGTSVLYRVNGACIECFPSAADVVMGNPVRIDRGGSNA